MSENIGFARECNAKQQSFEEVVGRVEKADLKIRKGDYKGGIEEYNKLIQKNPNIAFYYNQRGLAKLDIQDYEGSMNDFNRAVLLNRNMPEYYYHRELVKSVMQSH